MHPSRRCAPYLPFRAEGNGRNLVISLICINVQAIEKMGCCWEWSGRVDGVPSRVLFNSNQDRHIGGSAGCSRNTDRRPYWVARSTHLGQRRLGLSENRLSAGYELLFLRICCLVLASTSIRRCHHSLAVGSSRFLADEQEPRRTRVFLKPVEMAAGER